MFWVREILKQAQAAAATDRSKLITKPRLFDHKSQRSNRSESGHRCFEAYMKDLKEIHDKPNDNFDMDLGQREETRCLKLYGLLASLMRRTEHH